jgi:hypothetical protein
LENFTCRISCSSSTSFKKLRKNFNIGSRSRL